MKKQNILKSNTSLLLLSLDDFQFNIFELVQNIDKSLIVIACLLIFIPIILIFFMKISELLNPTSNDSDEKKRDIDLMLKLWNQKKYNDRVPAEFQLNYKEFPEWDCGHLNLNDRRRLYDYVFYGNAFVARRKYQEGVYSKDIVYRKESKVYNRQPNSPIKAENDIIYWVWKNSKHI